MLRTRSTEMKKNCNFVEFGAMQKCENLEESDLANVRPKKTRLNRSKIKIGMISIRVR